MTGLFNTTVYPFHTCSLSIPPDNHRDTDPLLCCISWELRRSGCNSPNIFFHKIRLDTLSNIILGSERNILTKHLKYITFIIPNLAQYYDASIVYDYVLVWSTITGKAYKKRTNRSSNQSIKYNYCKKLSIYHEYILDQYVLVYNQDRFPLHCHNNRPDSSEDTLKNSSSRSSLVTDNLNNNKTIMIK